MTRAPRLHVFVALPLSLLGGGGGGGVADLAVVSGAIVGVLLNTTR